MDPHGPTEVETLKDQVETLQGQIAELMELLAAANKKIDGLIESKEKLKSRVHHVEKAIQTLAGRAEWDRATSWLRPT